MPPADPSAPGRLSRCVLPLLLRKLETRRHDGHTDGGAYALTLLSRPVPAMSKNTLTVD